VIQAVFRDDASIPAARFYPASYQCHAGKNIS
jgi:hypothetical protein